MEPFKNLYNKKSCSELAFEIEKYSKDFDQNQFLKDCLKNIKQLEMKERVVQIASALDRNLKGSYLNKLKIFNRILKAQNLDGFILWPISYYIESQGSGHFQKSMQSIYYLTQVFTGEFAIRPFLNQDYPLALEFLTQWSEDPNEHVRRLVSEGTRPNLPWGKKITHIKNHFKSNINLLEHLKLDDSLYVRKSVANHLNDISWYEPNLLIKTLTKWNKDHPQCPKITWITKQALRSLIKQGNPKALQLMGYSSPEKIKLKQFKLSQNKISEGSPLDFKFKIKNTSKNKSKVLVDFNIYYLKSNGSLSPKTFKLKSLELSSLEEVEIVKKFPMKKVTTRKHYPGKHFLEIQINGKKMEKLPFNLKI